MKYTTTSLGYNQKHVFEDGTTFETRPLAGKHNDLWRTQHKINRRVVSRDRWWSELNEKKESNHEEGERDEI
jgi:hypothetical protein